jgi:hypothetical protein
MPCHCLNFALWQAIAMLFLASSAPAADDSAAVAQQVEQDVKLLAAPTAEARRRS